MKMEGELNELKDSVDMAHYLVKDETENRISANKALKNEIIERGKEISSNVQVLKSHGAEIRGLKEDSRQVRQRCEELREEQLKVSVPLNEIRQKVESTLSSIEFPIKRTLIAQNIWYKEGEDLMQIVKTIIHKALGLPEVPIHRTERKSGQKTGSGLIKIELASKDDVRKVLSRKKDLKDVPVQEIRKVYLQQSRRGSSHDGAKS